MAYLETAVCLSPNLGDFQLLFLKHSFFLGFSPSLSNCCGRLHLGPLALEASKVVSFLSGFQLGPLEEAGVCLPTKPHYTEAHPAPIF